MKRQKKFERKRQSDDSIKKQRRWNINEQEKEKAKEMIYKRKKMERKQNENISRFARIKKENGMKIELVRNTSKEKQNETGTKRK